MARSRRPSRTGGRSGSGTARSKRAEAERPAASRRASAASANRHSARAPAAETEEAAAATGPQTGTDPALEPTEAPAAEPASSSNRERAQGSSRRAPAQGKAASGRARPSSTRARAQGGGNKSTTKAKAVRSSRRAAEVDPRAALKQKILIGIIGAVLLLVIGGLLAWPGFRRGMILSELDEAPDAASAQAVAQRYLEYVNFNPGHVQGAINANRGPVSARVYMAQQIASADLLLAIAAAPGLVDDDRALALEAAAVLIEDDTPSSGYIDQERLEEWAVQPERDEKHPALAMAAAHLIAARATDNAAEVLAGVIRDPDQHPAILAAAVANLPKVVDSGNVGFALLLVTSPNNDAVLESEMMLHAITTSVRAAHVDRIFELLDHADARVQAAGARFLSGNGIANAGRDQAESIGQRISPYLTAEMRSTKPEVFGEALKVVSNLRLTGARDQLLKLLPEVPADSEDARLLAQILGRNFIRDDEGWEDIANQVLAGLAAAVADPQARATAAAALQQVQVRELPGLRVALEACIAQGEDAACMDAAHHIVDKLYQRTDVTSKLGRDVAAWRAFLQQDRPRFEEYQGIRGWMAENAEARVTDGGEKIKAAKVQCDRYTSLLGEWLAPNGEPMPLGLTKPMVERTMGQLKQVQYSLMKATPGL